MIKKYFLTYLLNIKCYFVEIEYVYILLDLYKYYLKAYFIFEI